MPRVFIRSKFFKFAAQVHKMGAYLSSPVTKKEQESGSMDWLRYGSTSMQGWRTNQEVSSFTGLIVALFASIACFE
jgi:hypothetical protein